MSTHAHRHVVNVMYAVYAHHTKIFPLNVKGGSVDMYVQPYIIVYTSCASALGYIYTTYNIDKTHIPKPNIVYM